MTYQRKPLTSERFSEIVKDVRKKGKDPQTVLMPVLTYADVRKWGREILDIEAQADLLKRGITATAEDVKIGLHREIPMDMLYFYDVAFDDPDMGELDAQFIYLTCPPVEVYDLISGCWQPGTPAGKDA